MFSYIYSDLNKKIFKQKKHTLYPVRELSNGIDLIFKK